MVKRAHLYLVQVGLIAWVLPVNVALAIIMWRLRCLVERAAANRRETAQ